MHNIWIERLRQFLQTVTIMLASSMNTTATRSYLFIDWHDHHTARLWSAIKHPGPCRPG